MSETAKGAKPAAIYLGAGWVCLIIGVVLLLLPYRLYYVTVPLCLAAIALSFYAIKRGGGKPAATLMWTGIFLPLVASLAGLLIESFFALF